MEHLNEQAVAGHLSTQVFAVQVVFSERAERAQLTQTQQQVSKASKKVGGRAQCVLQQGSLNLLMHTLSVLMVFKLLHIWSVGGNGVPWNECVFRSLLLCQRELVVKCYINKVLC